MVVRGNTPVYASGPATVRGDAIEAARKRAARPWDKRGNGAEVLICSHQHAPSTGKLMLLTGR